MHLVTKRDEMFFRATSDDESSVLAVRAGRPLGEVLEQAQVLVDQVQGTLKELARAEAMIGPRTLWALSSVLKVAQAEMHAVVKELCFPQA